MDLAPGEAKWAQEEFGEASLGDVRRVQRLAALATIAAVRPAGEVTEVFTGAAEQERAYRDLRSGQIDGSSS